MRRSVGPGRLRYEAAIRERLGTSGASENEVEHLCFP